MLSCGYWNKQIPRFNKNKADRRWDQFLVDELKGKTMGIIGYGDIGKACAKLAKAYGMKVCISLRLGFDVQGLVCLFSILVVSCFTWSGALDILVFFYRTL